MNIPDNTCRVIHNADILVIKTVSKAGRTTISVYCVSPTSTGFKLVKLNGEETWEMTTDGDDLVCHCPHSQFNHGMPCKHVRAMKASKLFVPQESPVPF